MAAGVTIKHKQKASAFVDGELAIAELGLDTTNCKWYFSINGTTIIAIPKPTETMTRGKTIAQNANLM